MNRLIRATVLVSVAIALVSMPVAAKGTSPSITVNAQATQGGEVVVETANIDRAGWVVIHPDIGTREDIVGDVNPSQILGKTYITAGTNTDVTVNLSQNLVQNQSLYAMLHYDDPADQRFTFALNRSQDPPVKSGNETVVKHFFVAIGQGSAIQKYAEAKQKAIEETTQNQQKIRNLEEQLRQSRDLLLQIDQKSQEVKNLIQDINSTLSGTPSVSELQSLAQRVSQVSKNLDTSQGGGNNAGDTGGTNNTSSSDGKESPGFTAVVALLAVLSVAVIAYRRR
ncbi:MAG: PGF-CTERM sorting domain-containing protein [Halobacteria archaeon]|nr:PGF-CTERM sorting domain-containing protein [Halobacteria archaeon]